MWKKCSTDQRFIRKRNTTYKIGTLDYVHIQARRKRFYIYEALKLENPGTAAGPDITLYYHVSHIYLYAGFEAWYPPCQNWGMHHLTNVMSGCTRLSLFIHSTQIQFNVPYCTDFSYIEKNSYKFYYHSQWKISRLCANWLRKDWV